MLIGDDIFFSLNNPYDDLSKNLGFTGIIAIVSHEKNISYFFIRVG